MEADGQPVAFVVRRNGAVGDRSRLVVIVAAAVWVSLFLAVLVTSVVRVAAGTAGIVGAAVAVTFVAAVAIIGLTVGQDILGSRASLRPALAVDATGVGLGFPEAVPWSEIADVGVRVVDAADRPRPDAATKAAMTWVEAFERRVKWLRAPWADRTYRHRTAAPLGRSVVVVGLAPGARTQRRLLRRHLVASHAFRNTARTRGDDEAAALLDAATREIARWQRAWDSAAPRVYTVIALDESARERLDEAVERYLGRRPTRLPPLGPGDLDAPHVMAEVLAEVARRHDRMSDGG